MNLENEIVYVKTQRKEYIYVLTNNNDNNNQLDVSIFEIEEWTHLTKISKVFEDSVVNLDVDKSLRPYINISENINIYNVIKCKKKQVYITQVRNTEIKE